MVRRKVWLVLVFCLAWPAALAWGQDADCAWPPARVPLESLFTGLVNDMPRLSPDARMVAWVREGRARAEVFLMATDMSRPPQQRWPLPVDAVRQMQWSQDGSRLLVETDEGLLILDPSTGALRRLPETGQGEVQVVSVRGPRPGEALLAMAGPGGKLPHLFAYHLANGQKRLVAKNRIRAVSWWMDASTGALAALRPLKRGGLELLVSQGLGQPFRRLLRLRPTDRQIEVVGFSEQGRRLLVLRARGSGPIGLEALDTRGAGSREVYRHPRHDVDEVLLDAATGRAGAVQVVGQRAFWVGLEAEAGRQLQHLSGLVSGDASLADQDGLGRYLIIKEISGERPARFLLYERQSGALREIITGQEGLDGYAFGRMRAVSFAARDGLELYGYLILPPGQPPGPLPLVIRVHAGPWSRHLYGFSLEGQWLANLGLAVLHLNYRGSTGFGQDYLDAGDRQWGAKMLDDLLDARDQLAGQGIIDPGRVALMGASYGGYAALMALALHPLDFAGAVTFAAPSDLVSLLPALPGSWLPVFHQRVGRLPEDREFLRQHSPLTHARRVVRPVFMAHGGQDPVVPLAQGQAMARALRGAGKDVVLVVFEGEGHHLREPENRLRFYRQAEEFLVRCLGLDRAAGAAAKE